MKAMAEHRRQRGAATLIIVMGLVLVMALLAAFANRSLLIELRSGHTHASSQQAQHMAEAGIDWALAQLNGMSVDGQCQAAGTAGQRFADRYLRIEADGGRIQPRTATGGLATDCTRAVSGWQCRCPAPGQRAAPGGPSDDTPAASFGLQWSAGHHPGQVRVTSLGCSDAVVDRCQEKPALGGSQTASARAEAVLGLFPAVRTPPAAPLVARQDLLSSGGLGLHNDDARAGGWLYLLGGSATGLADSRLDSLPGTPLNQVRVENDDRLQGDLFRQFMGMTPQTYQRHPALRRLACSSDCTSAIEDAYRSGARMLWVTGPAQVRDLEAGSEADPLVLIVDGDLTVQSGLQWAGMLVARGHLRWINTGSQAARVTGIVLVEGRVETQGQMDIHYRQRVADQLQRRVGSFVRSPSGWNDYR